MASRANRIASAVLGGLLCLAGIAIAVSAFLAAHGDAGPPENFPGSVIDQHEGAAALLIAGGAAIALLGVVAAWRRAWLAAAGAAACAIAVGVGIDSLDVHFESAVAARTYSVLELRGTGPVLAVASAITATCAGVLLGIVLLASDASSWLRRQPEPTGRWRA